MGSVCAPSSSSYPQNTSQVSLQFGEGEIHQSRGFVSASCAFQATTVPTTHQGQHSMPPGCALVPPRVLGLTGEDGGQRPSEMVSVRWREGCGSPTEGTRTHYRSGKTA